MGYKRTIGFTCGAFDLVHPGHMVMFEDAKHQCGYLIVGLQSDPTIDRPDVKNDPVQTVEERLEMLRAIRYIDEIVLYDTEKELYELLKELKPNIRIIGTDWQKSKSGFTGDDLPIRIYWHQRSHDWSSSDLRERVFESEKYRCGGI